MKDKPYKHIFNQNKQKDDNIYLIMPNGKPKLFMNRHHMIHEPREFITEIPITRILLSRF